jgi:hypothetical protein
MDSFITLIFGIIQLIFVLWFTFSVVEKLKRSERLLRELLRTANPNHPDFVTPAEPSSEPYTAEQIKEVMSRLEKGQEAAGKPQNGLKGFKPDAPYIC